MESTWLMSKSLERDAPQWILPCTGNWLLSCPPKGPGVLDHRWDQRRVAHARLLKLRWMGTQGVQMKRVRPWLVRRSAKNKIVLSWPYIVPIAQQPGQAVVQDRLSMNVCLRVRVSGDPLTLLYVYFSLSTLSLNAGCYYNYLCTCDLYSPMHNVLDGCIYITWGSGRGLGPGIPEFFWALWKGTLRCIIDKREVGC